MTKLSFIPVRTVLLLLLSSSLLFSCKNDPKEIDDLLSKASLKEDRAEDVVIIYSEEGNSKIRMFAKEFIRNEGAKPPYTEMRNGLKVEFFNDSMEVDNTVTALYARYYEEKGNVLLRDSVVVVNATGETLKTEELIWNQGVRKFFTEKFVRITTPDQIMFGDGLEANEDFTWYRILNPKGTVRVKKDQMPE